MAKVKLGDVCKVQGGYAFKSKEFLKNNIPIVRIGNIQDNEVKKFIGEDYGVEVKKYELKVLKSLMEYIEKYDIVPFIIED